MSTSSLGFRAAAPVDGPAGTLALSVGRPAARTEPVRTESSGVLRLMKPIYLDESGQVTYIVVNPGGAYFGERCRMDVEVLPGAHLLLASQGATRIYRTPNAPAIQESVFRIGAGARLEYVPEQIIAYRDADYRQATEVVVASDAQAFIGEIVTPGWDPDGTPFTYTAMRLRLDVRVDAAPRPLRSGGGLVCSDNVRVLPAAIGAEIAGIGHLEGASHMGSVLVVGTHTGAVEYADGVRALIGELGQARAGVTTGSRHGVSWLMVRALADSTDALNELVYGVNQFDRAATTGQGRLDLRRY